MEPNISQTAPVIFECAGSPTKQKTRNNIIIIVVAHIIAMQAWPYLSQSVGMLQNNSTQVLNDLVKIVIPLIIGGLIISLLFFFRKTHNKFSIDSQGISVDNKGYLWSDAKNFHMLGDSQDERTGLGEIKYTGGYDVVNPYKGLGVYVIKFKGLTQKTIRLQVSPEQANEFENILASHGILRESQSHMYFTGVNKWFILLFIIPFGLIVILMLYGTLSSR